VSALIDTSVLIGTEPPTDVELDDDWAISAISVGELDAGVLLASEASVRAARLRRLTAVLAEAPILAIDRAVAARYGELRAASGRLPTNDLWIAATALAHDLNLLTRDERQAALPLVRTTLVR
jgi:predicted nucleic acid-binding protein